MGRPCTLKYEYKGEMLTVSEISQRSGIRRDTLRSRIENGTRLDAPLYRSGPLLIPFRGRQMRAREIARLVGVTPECIIARYMRGQELDRPAHPGDTQPAKRTEPLGQSVFIDDRPYIFDMRARHVMNYMQRSETVSTDDDIRAGVAEWIAKEFGPDARLTDDGVALCREWLREDMFAHSRGHSDSLEFIGDLDGVCRERIRQIEIAGARAFKANAQRLGVAEDVIRELRAREAERRESWGEYMERVAPGNIESFAVERTRVRRRKAKEAA